MFVGLVDVDADGFVTAEELDVALPSLVWAAAHVDRALAWDAWRRMTLHAHTESYPAIWEGTLSGPDAWNAPEFSRAGRTWAAAFRRIGVDRGHHVATLLPNGSSAHVAWLGIGWLVARLLRALFMRVGAGLNRLLDSVVQPLGARRLRLAQPIVALIGNVIFWVVVLIFAATAARVGRLDAFTAWLDRIVAYLPTLLAGGLIALAGYLVSTLIRDVVSATVASTRLRSSTRRTPRPLESHLLSRSHPASEKPCAAQ